MQPSESNDQIPVLMMSNPERQCWMLPIYAGENQHGHWMRTQLCLRVTSMIIAPMRRCWLVWKRLQLPSRSEIVEETMPSETTVKRSFCQGEIRSQRSFFGMTIAWSRQSQRPAKTMCLVRAFPLHLICLGILLHHS